MVRVNQKSVGFQAGEISSNMLTTNEAERYVYGSYFSQNTIHDIGGSVIKRAGTTYIFPAVYGEHSRMHVIKNTVVISQVENNVGGGFTHSGTFFIRDTHAQVLEKANLYADDFLGRKAIYEGNVYIRSGMFVNADDVPLHNPPLAFFRPAADVPHGDTILALDETTTFAFRDDIIEFADGAILIDYYAASGGTPAYISASIVTVNDVLTTGADKSELTKSYPTVSSDKFGSKFYGFNPCDGTTWETPHSARISPVLSAFDPSKMIQSKTFPDYDTYTLQGSRLILGKDYTIKLSALPGTKTDFSNFLDFTVSTAPMAAMELSFASHEYGKITSIAGFRNSLIVGFQSAIVMVAAAGDGAMVANANFVPTTQLLMREGVAPVRSVVYGLMAFFVGKNRQSIIQVKKIATYGSAKAFEASYIDRLHEVCGVNGLIEQIEVSRIQGVLLLLARTDIGKVIVMNIEANFATSVWEMGEVKKISIMRNVEGDPLVYFLVKRGTKYFVELLTLTNEVKKQASFYAKIIDPFLEIDFAKGYDAYLKALYKVEYYMDCASMFCLTKTGLLQYDGNGKITSTVDLFFPEIEQNGYIEHGEVQYEILSVVDAKTANVSTQKAHYDHPVNMTEYTLKSRVIKHLDWLQEEPYIALAADGEVFVVMKSLKDQNYSNGVLRLPFYVSHYTVGIPYRMLLQSVPIAGAEIPSRARSARDLRVLTQATPKLEALCLFGVKPDTTDLSYAGPIVSENSAVVSTQNYVELDWRAIHFPVIDQSPGTFFIKSDTPNRVRMIQITFTVDL